MRIWNATLAATATLALAAITTGSGAAMAGEACGHCYRKVVTPPVYSEVSETVMVRPPHAYFRHIPAEYGTVREKVLLRPEQTVAHRVPAELRQVAETVLVAPASRQWQVSRDAWGREIGCWVKVPARYATEYRTVVVRPASVEYETLPAVYTTRERTVVVRQGTIEKQYVPAVYGTRTREVMVAPASAHWQPLRGRSHW